MHCLPLILYDTFDVPPLDDNKWNETTASGFPDEHGVNASEKAYHVAQPTIAGDKDVVLIMTKGFWNETVEYDMTYKPGGGNHEHWVNFLPFSFAPPCPDINCYIGYWNVPGSWGNQTGTYHITVAFNSTGKNAHISVKRPDRTFWKGTFDLSSHTPPYHIYMYERTGHNGQMHFDIDNVVIRKC
jgi:hypothetical protein